MQSKSSNKCVYHYDVEILNISDAEVQLINTKPMVKKIKRIVKWVEKV